jgi:S-adenosyl-L-methionine hydrolase (adenosine-forming)
MIVTFLSDFGTADYFAGAMKGAVLAVEPGAQLVDITHDIPPHDIEAGAFTLAAAFGAFPPGTVHVAVVDPGVGSERRGLVVEAAGHLFVGPDNGLFGHVYERADDPRVFQLLHPPDARAHVSATFHGRDVFAPAAGALARGAKPEDLGAEVRDFVRLAHARPELMPDGSLTAAVIHVDRFGNLVTNVTGRELAPAALLEGRARLAVRAREVRAFRRFYADERGAADPAEPFAIWGSAGFLEISVNRASAAHTLGARRGQKIKISLESGVYKS